MPASLRKICVLIVSLRQMTKIPVAHLGIDFRRLAATDCPPPVDDGEGDASDTLLPRLRGAVLDFHLELVRVEELGGLCEMSVRSSDSPLT